MDSIDNLLEKDGHLILTVPSKNLSLRSKHYQHFDLDGLKAVLPQGYEVVEMQYLNKMSILNAWIKKLMSNKLFIINNARLLKFIYGYYMKNLLMANASDATRMYLMAIKR